MKILKNCQCFDSEGYRTHKEDLPLDVMDGILINPYRYNEPIVLSRDGFKSSEFKKTAEVAMLCAAWSLFVDSDKLHVKAKELGAKIIKDGSAEHARIIENL